MYRAGIIFLVAPLIAGCGLELLGTTAIQSELQRQNADQLSNVLDRSEGRMGRMGAEQAIEAYRAEHGTYPPSLEAMVREGYLTEVPRQSDGAPYGYDAATGRLMAGAPAMSDQQRLYQIREAIMRYWQERRAYPPSLEALVPDYLSEVPRTASGHGFWYDPATATVNLPLEAAQHQQPRPPGSGLTPMGEAMTGLGAQQHLRQGGSATSSARGHAGSRLDGITDRHDQQQQRAMDELGF